VVTLCKTRFNIQQFYILPAGSICLDYISEKKIAVITVYSINCLIYITEAECVYCAVRTVSLNRHD